MLAQSADEVYYLIYEEEEDFLDQDGVMIKDKYGNTPLHHHASSDAEQSPAIVKALVEALVEAGASVNVQNKRLQTALHLAETPQIVKVILEAGGDPFEIYDKDGRTAFEAQSGSIEAMRRRIRERAAELELGESAVTAAALGQAAEQASWDEGQAGAAKCDALLPGVLCMLIAAALFAAKAGPCVLPVAAVKRSVEVQTVASSVEE